MGKENFSDQAANILEAHYQDENFGVIQLAEKLSVSRSQLHRKLVAAVGKSATAYIREFRLKKSLELLNDGDRTVSEVAYSCGFSNPSYFNTCFSKYFGFPPGEVRNRHSPPVEEQEAGAGMEIITPPNSGRETNHPTGKAKRAPYLLWGIAGMILAVTLYFSTKPTPTDTQQAPGLAEKSIAVLPFENQAGNADMEAVCDGITDDIIARLATYPGFSRVISRTSAFQFRGSRSATSQIARALGVSHILQGTVQQAETRIKINVRLLEGQSERQIWSHEYAFEWRPEAVYEIQASLARSVARELGLTLADSRQAREMGPPTQDREAYDHYVQGVYQAYKLDEKSLLNAETLLTRAIELDSNFAEAYTALGYVWSARAFGDVLEDQKGSYRQAKYYFAKSHDLDSTLWQNELYALQAAFYLDWDFGQLEAFFSTEFPNHVYSREISGFLDYAIKTGRYQEALDACNASIRVNPLDAVLYSFKARALWLLGRKEEGLEILQQTDQLYDKDWFYLREAAHSYFLMGAYEQSYRVLDLLLNHFQDRSPTIVWLDLMRAQRAGQVVQVQARLQELLRAYRNSETGSPAWYIGLYYAAMGDADTAFDWLERSFERFDVEMTWLREEPLLEPLRDHPRYIALAGKVGFPE